MSDTTVDKSVALVTSMSHEMDEPCPVCRGGWWYEDGTPVYAVHATECTRKDESAPSRNPA